MATITGSTASAYWTHKLEVIENSVDATNNTSSVTVDVYIGRGATAGASYMHGANISVTIGMTGCTSQTFTYKNSNRVDVAQGAWLKLGSVTFASVPHDSNGAKTVTVTSSFTNTISPASGSASGTMALTRSSFAVSYNANGGSGAPSAQTKYYGTNLTLSSTTPTKSNYTFLGWGTSASDTSVDYAAGATYTSNASTTLYAIWRASVSLAYNANGGSGAPSATNDYIYNATTSKSITVSSTSPSRTGYTFKGWSTSSTATTASYQAGSSVSVNANSTVTLYAVWSANSYTVTFNANGGTTPTASKSVTYDSTYGTLPTPTRDGHIFNGWYTATSGGNKIETSTKVSITANQTLYAQWTPWSYTVAYNVNGGSSTAPASQTKTYGETINITSTIPTKTGYNFTSWNTESNGSGTSYSSGQTYEYDQNGGTVTLYAQWTPWVHTVSYNLNGSTSIAPSNQIKTYGTSIVVSSTVPTRSGYTFVCWNTKADGTGTTYNSGQTYSFEQDGGTVTLYAIWKHANVVYWKIDNEYVLCNIYVKLDNEWKPCLCYIKMDDEWKLSVN